jgi:hypothetical protein
MADQRAAYTELTDVKVNDSPEVKEGLNALHGRIGDD